MKIMYLNGALTGQTMDLSPSGTTIGRESDNTIQLPMGGVSRYHAKIERDAAGTWLIRDLGSTNGTLVDDVPVSGSAPLSAGSVITIGDQLLRCVDSGAAAPNPAQPAQPAQPAPASAPQPAPISPAEVPHGLFGKKQDKPRPSGSKKFLSNVIFAFVVVLIAIVGL